MRRSDCVGKPFDDQCSERQRTRPNRYSRRCIRRPRHQSDLDSHSRREEKSGVELDWGQLPGLPTLARVRPTKVELRWRTTRRGELALLARIDMLPESSGFSIVDFPTCLYLP